MSDSITFEYNENEIISCCYCSNQIPKASIYCPMCGVLLRETGMGELNTDSVTDEKRQYFEATEFDNRNSSGSKSLSFSKQHRTVGEITAKNKKSWIVGIVVVLLCASMGIGFYKSREGNIQVPFSSAQISGESLDKIYKELEDAGFENITKEQDTSGWLEDEKVTHVTIDSGDTFNEGEYRAPDAKVVIYYSSKGRTEVSGLLENWSKTDYETVVKKLKNAGFKNVSVEEEATFAPENNNLVSGLSLHGKEYTKGKCYLPASASINISYYKLKIIIETKSSKFKKKNYEGVVDALKDLGFTNIQLFRTDDLKTGLITKEGSVKSISIDGDSKFKKDESFYYDVPIEIVVNTFEGKGCDEITDVKY